MNPSFVIQASDYTDHESGSDISVSKEEVSTGTDRYTPHSNQDPAFSLINLDAVHRLSGSGSFIQTDSTSVQGLAKNRFHQKLVSQLPTSSFHSCSQLLKVKSTGSSVNQDDHTFKISCSNELQDTSTELPQQTLSDNQNETTEKIKQTENDYSDNSQSLKKEKDIQNADYYTLPLELKRAFCVELYPVLQKTAAAYSKSLGSKHQLTIQANDRLEEMERIINDKEKTTTV